MEGFYRKNGGARELLEKQKKLFFLDQDIFCEGREEQGFSHTDASSSSWGWRGSL